jgi:hypothetical protein
MATIDRIEPAYTPWSPSKSGFGEAVTTDVGEEYVGKHRRPGARGLNILRMFYAGKHRV